MSTILVVIDPDEAEHAGLNRIRALPIDAADFQVELYVERFSTTLRDRLMSSSVRHKVPTQTANQKLAWLEMLVQPMRNEGYSIKTAVVVFDCLFEAIIQSAERLHVDYIFKPLRQHGFLRRALFSATDWNLVRCSSKPVLLASHAYPIRGKPVIAAVDVAAEDQVHQELNQIVLAQARQLAKMLGSTVYLVNAFSLSAYAGASPTTDPLAYKVVFLQHKNQLKAAQRIAKQYEITENQVYVREGAADRVINDYSRELDAGVIVLGTVARSGISGLFIGNTAESVMEHAQSDVVVVKQADFISPICSVRSTAG